MKIKRYKKVRQILKFYSLNFGFRKPYQVLIDGTLCVAALKHKVDIQDQFPKYLDGEVKLLTTQCMVLELEKLGSEVFGGLLIIKKFPTHKCPHLKSPVSGSQCILDMIQDESARYIVATQDRELQQKCRKIPGIPLLYLHMKTPNLEGPSEKSQQKADNLAASRLTTLEKEKLSCLNEKLETDENPPKRKKKRKGGPNPLSCKKKKRKVDDSQVSQSKKEGAKKRKRTRNRFVQKVKKELMASSS